jgi:hypothetical protein
MHSADHVAQLALSRRLVAIEPRVHSSWSLALPLIAYVCIRLGFPSQLPGLDAGTNLAVLVHACRQSDVAFRE